RSELPLSEGVAPLHCAVELDLTTSADRPAIGMETLTSEADDVLWSPLPVVEPSRRPTDASPRRFTLVREAVLEPPAGGSGPASPIATPTPNAVTLSGLAWPL